MSLLPCITQANPTTPLYASLGSGGGGGGGSGQSTFTVSTLTVSDIVFPDTFNISGNKSKLSSIGVDELSVNSALNANGGLNLNNTTLNWNNLGTAGTYWDAGQNKLFTIVGNGDTVQIGTQGNPFAFSVSQSSINTNVVLQSPALSSLSLLVSSVNGAPYPPQGSGTISTIGFNPGNFPGGNGNVPISGTPFAITDSFVVDTTHRYRVSYEASFSNADPNSYTTVYISATAPTQYLQTVPNAQANTASNDARASVSGVFVPSSSPAQLIVANSSGSSITQMALLAASGVVLEDLGAI